MVKRFLGFICGVTFGILVTACATATFPYHYFGLDLKGEMLRGPTALDDLPLAECNATATDASPCTVVKAATMLELKRDYIDTKNALIVCQAQLAAK
jgi:hypothetical protein